LLARFVFFCNFCCTAVSVTGCDVVVPVPAAVDVPAAALVVDVSDFLADAIFAGFDFSAPDAEDAGDAAFADFVAAGGDDFAVFTGALVAFGED
jgi:hypothetical protein